MSKLTRSSSSDDRNFAKSEENVILAVKCENYGIPEISFCSFLYFAPRGNGFRGPAIKNCRCRVGRKKCILN